MGSSREELKEKMACDDRYRISPSSAFPFSTSSSLLIRPESATRSPSSCYRKRLHHRGCPYPIICRRQEALSRQQLHLQGLIIERKGTVVSLYITMWHARLWVLLLAIGFFTTALRASEDRKSSSTPYKTSVYLSPPFFLRPGSVVDKYYFGIPFPKGHIALKSFDAEVVDEMGNPVPLHETYLHHWVVGRYYGQKEAMVPRSVDAGQLDLSKIISVRNAGICKNTLGQYFGLGSETRKTDTWVPGPYGIEVGSPEKIPDGYEERWILNVHAIDTRGVNDRLGCTECRCSLYNVTMDQHNQPLRKDYVGGLHCCYDQTQCHVREGFQNLERKLYLRYTIRWADWDESIVPVKIYIFDVTDSRGLPNSSTEANAISSCKVEYDVKACSPGTKNNGECIDTRRVQLAIPQGGDIVYGVAHQHSGGIGSALYRQDGRLLCASIPTYGKGEAVGDESGYIVGMSTCYPNPGSARVADGEILIVESNYSSSQQHTGVMGLFYIMVAEPQLKQVSVLEHSLPVSWAKKLPKYSWAFILTGAIVAVMVMVFHRGRNGGDYQSLAMDI